MFENTEDIKLFDMEDIENIWGYGKYKKIWGYGGH